MYLEGVRGETKRLGRERAVRRQTGSCALRMLESPEEPVPIPRLAAPPPPKLLRRPLEPVIGGNFGRYIILECLGQGGMGVVFGAYDTELERQVALKLCRLDPNRRNRGERGHDRLFREGKYMARVSHPNVVMVHDLGEVNGRAFLAMEYVEGCTLTKWLTHDRSWAEILDVFVQAGRGLAATHAAGVVHRDFKPDNILVGSQGRVQLTDFGLSRTLETRPSTDPDDGLTQPGLVMGTPPYMSPEHGSGAAADPAMDQFSFCVALFDALYRCYPFEGTNREEIRAEILQGRVREPIGQGMVPARLHSILARGLAAHPKDRWASLSDLLTELQPAPKRRGWDLANRLVALTSLGRRDVAA